MSTVRARIDSETKQRAVAALDAMGLDPSMAIRLLMYRIANDRRIPVTAAVSSAAAATAVQELIGQATPALIAAAQARADKLGRPLTDITIELLTRWAAGK